MLVSSTHTHSGPATLPLEGWGRWRPPMSKAFPRCARWQPRGRSPHSTRFVSAPLRARFGRSVSIGCGCTGRSTASLHVLRIDSIDRYAGGGRSSATAAIPSASTGVLEAGTAISADWPGQVARRLHEEGYGEAIFRLGVCGDIDPVVAWHQFAFEGMELSAELVTQSLLGVLRSVETTPALKLGLARGDVPLPSDSAQRGGHCQPRWRRHRAGYGSVRVTDSGVRQQCLDTVLWRLGRAMRAQLASQPEHVSVPLAALRVNDEVWLHLPGEVFTALGQAIAARSPFAKTVVTTLFGRFIGYLPDR